MSQNRMVITRRSPLAETSSGRSIRPSTMRGSTYLPKVSLICDLSLSSATMALKARVSRPISSREVTGTTVSSRPCCTALVPASSRRTGRDRPREKPPATRSPSSPARPVITTTARTTLAWRACAASAAAATIR